MQYAPYYWLNEDSTTFLKRGYLLPGVEPIDRIKQIAATAEKILGIEGFAAKFEDYMSRGFYSLSTPVWTNYGLKRGLAISCFGISIEDNLPDIFRSLGEIGTMSSAGGGTAGYLGKLRPRGATISNGGKSGGSVHFMEAFQTVSSVITQGEARRGHFAAYLPIDHPDIKEFLRCRTEGHPIQTLSTAVTIPAGWMQSMMDGDKEKLELWVNVLKSRDESGYPFVFFEDNVNNHKPQVYKDKDMQIKHSQMCVTGDQIVVTDKGMFTVYELYQSGEELTLFDGKKAVKSSPMKLIEKNAKVYTFTLTNGMKHTVTAEHKLKVLQDGKVEVLPAATLVERFQDLSRDKPQVFVQSQEGLFGTGVLTVKEIVADVLECQVSENVWQANKESILKFVQAACNTVSFTPGKFSTFTDLAYTQKVQILLANLGYNTKLSEVDDNPAEIFYTLEFLESGEDICHEIKTIEPAGTEDVYCVTVDTDEHLWTCNGFITHNCTEIMEYTDDKKSFTCCLSSLNLLHIDEILKTDAVETLTYFLDSVLTEFIEKASKIPYMEKAVKFAREHRSIGVGVLGWHSYLQSKMIPFEGMPAKLLNASIFKELDQRTLKASRELAVKFGEPKMLEGYGERFTTRMAIAPTTSSSFILGQVSPSIEPLAGNYFLKDLAKGKFAYKNPYLEKLLIELGQNTSEVWKSISRKGGSVQHLDFLTQEQKDVFKTFGEVSQLEIVQQAAARQKYIDQGQSLNLLIHPETPVREVSKLMIEAWRLGIKTLYYQRSVNQAQKVSRDLNECVSCES